MSNFKIYLKQLFFKVKVYLAFYTYPTSLVINFNYSHKDHSVIIVEVGVRELWGVREGGWVISREMAKYDQNREG